VIARSVLSDAEYARLAGDARREAADADACLHSVRSRLSPEERAAVDADPALKALFAVLETRGAKGAPRDVEAALIAGVSRTTLWRRIRAVFGCTYYAFVRRWRVDAAAPIYQCGKGNVRQGDVAKRTGLRTRSRLRAAFLACTGLLPTGRPPRSLVNAFTRGSPLFAGMA
jgi:AraC-like DNA-binding protein